MTILQAFKILREWKNNSLITIYKYDGMGVFSEEDYLKVEEYHYAGLKIKSNLFFLTICKLMGYL